MNTCHLFAQTTITLFKPEDQVCINPIHWIEPDYDQDQSTHPDALDASKIHLLLANNLLREELTAAFKPAISSRETTSA